jgi:hypothetical protein
VIVEVHGDHDPKEATDRGHGAQVLAWRGRQLSSRVDKQREAAPARTRQSSGLRPASSGIPPQERSPVCQNATRMDRRLASRNLRTALIAGAIAMIVFAASFVVGFVY